MSAHDLSLMAASTFRHELDSISEKFASVAKQSCPDTSKSDPLTRGDSAFALVHLPPVDPSNGEIPSDRGGS